MADACGLIYNGDHLLEALKGRESLCSTSIIPGVAFPHPRDPLPYDIAQSFIAIGLTPSGVPFGAPDGSLTRAFFLICCKDENTHLHVLARLCRMLQDENLIGVLNAANSGQDMIQLLTDRELEVIS